MDRTFIVGTRGSRLALAQTALVVDALKAAHPGAKFEVREITTQGDRDTKPLSEIGGQGVFTKAIEDALLAGTIDIAVHSMKDLPPRLTDGLVIAAVPERASPLDALLTVDGARLEDLAVGARIGTGSGRRSAHVRTLRPDLTIAEIRGNVPTRIAKLDSREYDGIVLAVAGLARLGLGDRISQTFSVMEMTPSPGQGALAVQTRSTDNEASRLAAQIDDATTRVETVAERSFLEALGAGCTTPVGAHASVDGAGAVGLAVSVAVRPDHVEWLRTTRGPVTHMSRGGPAPSEYELALGAAESCGLRAAKTVIDAGWIAL